MIKAAVSRQREFLADASAVQFTRNPEGICGALKKIMNVSEGSRISSAHASEASHLFFSSSLSGFWSGLFATHPPLPERIRAIEGAQATLETKQASTPKKTVSTGQTQSGLVTNDTGLNAALGVSMLSGGGTAVPSHRGEVEQMAQSSAPQAKHLDFAGGYMGALPAKILSSTTNAFSARAVVLHLLLTGENYSPENKKKILSGIVDAPLLAEFLSLADDFETLQIDQRLPLLDLCIPSLKHLSPDQYKNFRAQIALVITADNQVDFLEFCLERTLVRHLDIYFKLIPPPRIDFLSADALSAECRVLISCLAHVGGSGEEEITRAYADGWKSLDSSARYPLLPLEECSIHAMDAALDKLSRSSPPVKRQFLQACAKTVLSNSTVDTFEAELLRAYADNLDTPLPPLAPA